MAGMRVAYIQIHTIIVQPASTSIGSKIALFI
jgi:hypothetical protein